jgi:glycosyltransferase involved in cell wall biosynthesis
LKYIHIVLGKGNPNRENGVNVVVHNLALYAHRRGADVEVWGLTKDTANNELRREYTLRLFHMPQFRYFLGSELKRALFGLEPEDLVHFHGVLLPEFHAIAHVLRKQTTRWIVSPHGAYSYQSIRKHYVKKILYFLLLDRPLMRDALAVHAFNETDLDAIRSLVVLPKQILLPNGCSVSTDEHVVSSRQGTHRPIFGYLGRLAIQHKGLDLMLSGFAEYKAEGGSGQLWLAGSGKERAELEDAVRRLGISSWTRFLGAQFGPEKASFFNQIDVFVHTSRWEGMPISALEAAAAGLPLLVSRETNIADYVSRWNAGFILDKNEPSAIKVAMQKAEEYLVSKKLNIFAQSAKHMAQTDFSWEQIVTSLLDACAEMRMSHHEA